MSDETKKPFDFAAIKSRMLNEGMSEPAPSCISPPREWWIKDSRHVFQVPREGAVRVVEYSALEAAQADAKDSHERFQEMRVMLDSHRARESELMNLVREMREALNYRSGTESQEACIAEADATLKRLGVTE